MLPVSVDGMIWLNTTYSSYHLSFFLAIALSICIAAGFVFSLVGLTMVFTMAYEKKTGWIFITLGVIGAVLFIVLSNVAIEKKNAFVPEPISYSVYFEENMDYKTLYENYNIISTDGNIVIIELKEN